MKITEKLKLLPLGILLAVVSCQDEPVFLSSEAPTVYSMVQVAEEPELLNWLEIIIPESSNVRATSFLKGLDLTEAVKRMDSLGNNLYSLNIESGDPLTLKNLWIYNNDGVLTGRLLHSRLDRQWLLDQGSFSGWDSYTGYFTVYNLNGDILYETEIINGQSPTQETSEGGRASGFSCVTQTIEVGCNYTPEYPENGSDCFYETITTCTWYADTNPNQNNFVGATYDPIPIGDFERRVAETCNSGYKWNSTYGCVPVCVLPGYGLNDSKTRCVKLNDADAWEEDICLKSAFENNPCLMEVWNTLKATNAAHEVLVGFLKSNPEAALCLDVKGLGSSVNGNTVTTGTISNASITISLNSQKLNRSKLSIARTILHEMIHAELQRMVVEAGYYNHLEQFAANYQGDDPFMMIWEYYNTYGNYIAEVNPGWQHEYMADYYIDFIASGLAELHPILSSQAFINYRTGSFVGNSTQPWTWDEFFVALAWSGLKKTDQYQTEVVDKGLQVAYDFYQSTAKEESSTNKCN